MSDRTPDDVIADLQRNEIVVYKKKLKKLKNTRVVHK